MEDSISKVMADRESSCTMTDRVVVHEMCHDTIVCSNPESRQRLFGSCRLQSYAAPP